MNQYEQWERACLFRYAWLRENPAWETEVFLSGLTPEQFDVAVDKAIPADWKPPWKRYG